MTDTLSALLDGPVAARFGRPCCEMKLVKGVWHWSNHADMDCYYPEVAGPIAAALWLDHMMNALRSGIGSVFAGCDYANSKHGWQVSIAYNDSEGKLCHAKSTSPTLLEALALAMLAVPAAGEGEE